MKYNAKLEVENFGEWEADETDINYWKAMKGMLTRDILTIQNDIEDMTKEKEAMLDELEKANRKIEQIQST